ncbi:adenylate/guanylate cyclase domain-containing protein [Novosphingobium sp.]|uniref:adenylate/guanylate cyclase domain-containing protein n=1 Tax=Novosphingobium sp. TaxID=1874826 RepID=UPI0025EEC45E|nr:adenylate/guanylate cyclase domain-containing protein [Novosphingobium sp.]
MQRVIDWLQPLRSRLAGFQPARTARGRLLLAMAALAMMIALVAPLFHDPVDRAAMPVHAGIADFSGYGAFNRPIELSGSWVVTWLGGGTGANRPVVGAQTVLRVPGPWRGAAYPGGRLPESGVVRFETVLRGLPPGRYQLYLAPITAASRIIVDGEVQSARGTLGATKATVRYDIRSQTVPLVSIGRDLNVRIEMASILHRENGLQESPVIGATQPMEDWYALKWARMMLYDLSLLLIAALGIALFLYRPRDRASLYFGLACLAYLPNSAIIGFDNVLLIAFPGLTFPTMMATQYLGGTIAMMFFLATANTLYPRESPRRMFGLIIGMFLAFLLAQIVLFGVLGDTLTASHIQRGFIVLTLATLFWVVGILVRAVSRGREGALLFLFGIALFVASFAVEAVVVEGWVAADRAQAYEFISLGVLMVLYSHMLLMAERFSLAVMRAEDSNADLRELIAVNTAITSDLQLRPLLERIVNVTTRIIHADRTSLFLAGDLGDDVATGPHRLGPNRPVQGDELAALVAEGVGAGQIAFASGTGLAGHSFRTGEIVAVPDAYADPRFNPAIDAQTGYRTKSALSIPITTRDGRRLGVMQALNRLDGLPFDADDVVRMAAFGAQAAIALDNARLFSELIAERNFDENIMRSMAGGVVAIDAAWRVTKINRAAGTILGLDETVLAGSDARPFVARTNPVLVEEVDAVLGGGESKLLLDYDLVVADGGVRAVNLSIVPLEGDSPNHGRSGVLVVIEDLSSEKRLQGAMRRFLTQDVVDQVMGREDGLLFGTACTASVLFADVRNFTGLAERLSARETVETLNELFGELFEAVAAHDGVLDKFLGDGVMAVYGAPLSRGPDAVNAVSSALAMIDALVAINARRCARGAPELRLGLGVTTGEVVAGTIGSPKRMDYTVIGDSVNLASRLQELTRDYSIDLLVCERTASLVEGRFKVRLVDRIRVRGRATACAIYAVEGPA